MKIDYSFKALTPLFTGSDENSGTLRTLRREKILLQNPIKFESKFKNKIERTAAFMCIVYAVYQNIDKKLKSDYYGFYEPFSNKIKAALASENKNQFLNKLLESCGISTLSDGTAQLVRGALDQFSDIEFLEVMREEHQYLMILLREYVSYFRSNEGKNSLTGINILEIPDFVENIDFIKNFENVPYFGGNSIRGYLRRIVMYDFCELAGITKLDKNMYHQLFTGGNITDSTGFEDIQKREKYLEMCPPLRLFGSAIGNMTIEGNMKVVGARLRCKENNTGSLSFWQLIEQNFGTRLDSSKTEKTIQITDSTGEEKNQMIYQYENFITGSVFDSSFVITPSEKEALDYSIFCRMINLWKENNFIGGNSARDSGLIDLDIKTSDGGEELYLDIIENDKEEIQKYFKN